MTKIIASVERAWRTVFVYPLFRLMFRNRPASLPIDLSTIDSVLILRFDKIGDMIVTLQIFEIMKSRNPNVTIGVVASEVNVDIVRDDKNVDLTFVLYRNPILLLHELLRIRKQRYQIVLDFIFNRMTSGALIANLACPGAIKIGQGQKKYGFYFNALLELPRGTMHMMDMLVSFIEQVFGLKVLDEEKVIRFPVDGKASETVDRFLERRGLRRRAEKTREGSGYLVFNISARQDNKRLTAQQATSIVAYLGNLPSTNTVVIAAPEDQDVGRRIIAAAKNSTCSFFPEGEEAGLKEIGSLIEGATSVITPDTAIVHIASAMSTPVLGIFTPLQVNREWLPYRVQYELLNAPNNQPVSAIPTETLIDGLGKFLGRDSILKEEKKES